MKNWQDEIIKSIQQTPTSHRGELSFLRNEENIQVYQNAYVARISQVLGSTIFAPLKRFVEENYLNTLLIQFVYLSPPKLPTITDYAHRFPEFLKTQNVADFFIDLTGICLLRDSLLIDEDAPPEHQPTKFTLAPWARFFSSRFSVYSLWTQVGEVEIDRPESILILKNAQGEFETHLVPQKFVSLFEKISLGKALFEALEEMEDELNDMWMEEFKCFFAQIQRSFK